MALQLGTLARLILVEYCDNNAPATFGVDRSTPTMWRVWVESHDTHHSVYVAIDDGTSDADINDELTDAAYKLTQEIANGLHAR